MTDPMADRPMTNGEAEALLRETVILNIQARGGINDHSRERDDIAARLRAAGRPANYADYTHPSEVGDPDYEPARPVAATPAVASTQAPKRVTIEFEPYATVADLREAAEYFRARLGPDAIVRARGTEGVDKDGPRITRITAEPAPAGDGD